jgi:hypothetical protein
VANRPDHIYDIGRSSSSRASLVPACAWHGRGQARRRRWAWWLVAQRPGCGARHDRPWMPAPAPAVPATPPAGRRPGWACRPGGKQSSRSGEGKGKRAWRPSWVAVRAGSQTGGEVGGLATPVRTAARCTRDPVGSTRNRRSAVVARATPGPAQAVGCTCSWSASWRIAAAG